MASTEAGASPGARGTVVELFAGVGGFRLGLEGVPEPFRSPDTQPGRWSVIWSNQWEPSTKTQHAFQCYSSRFMDGVHVNEDIGEIPPDSVPDHDLLVGGFPCQDYSVAKPLNQAHGIEGRKGVLWWSIYGILEAKRPRFVLLENVDRLLKSPGPQRGRDFAMILATMSDLGYLVEWRVVNAADYGFPQRRRRVFIVGRLLNAGFDVRAFDGNAWIDTDGALARSLPVEHTPAAREFAILGEAHEVSATFGMGRSVSAFLNAGVMADRHVWTKNVMPTPHPLTTLGSILQPDSEVPEQYFISDDRLGDEKDPVPGTWRYLKFAKREQRYHKGSGTAYTYTEGALPFPDPLERPARTILTGEGGTAPSRFKHVVKPDSRYRRLTPLELERANGFPDGWTEGMSDMRRAFCMGNALVVGVVERVGHVLADDLAQSKERVTKVVRVQRHAQPSSDLGGNDEVDEGQPGEGHEAGTRTPATA